MYSTWTDAHDPPNRCFILPFFFFFWINLVDDRTNGKKNENDQFVFFFFGTKSRSRIAGRLEHNVILDENNLIPADFSIIGKSKEIVF